MIENERQYQASRGQAKRLEEGLARLATPEAASRGISPALIETERAGIRHALATLYAELTEYEVRRAGESVKR